MADSLFGSTAKDLQDFVTSAFGGSNKYSFDAPSVPSSPTVAENLSAQNQAAQNASNNSYSTQLSAAREGAKLASDAYSQKAQTDYQSKVNTTAALQNSQIPSYAYSVDTTKRDIAGRDFVDIEKEEHDDTVRNQQFQHQLSAADHARYNQQLLAGTDYQNQSALARAQQSNAEKLASIDANARITAAGIGAQGSILGSLFGSVGSGSANYRYWN
jgi:hypothetical protein